MQIATFRAKCHSENCRQEFDVPLLSDFSYGEFIYSSLDGKQIRYYNSLDSDIWKFIDPIVSGYLANKNREDQGKIIQKLIGLVADRPNPDMFYTQEIYCPNCQSKVKSISDDYKSGMQEYESLSFNNFTSLIDLEKKILIDELIKGISK